MFCCRGIAYVEDVRFVYDFCNICTNTAQLLGEGKRRRKLNQFLKSAGCLVVLVVFLVKRKYVVINLTKDRKTILEDIFLFCNWALKVFPQRNMRKDDAS